MLSVRVFKVFDGALPVLGSGLVEAHLDGGFVPREMSWCFIPPVYVPPGVEAISIEILCGEVEHRALS